MNELTFKRAMVLTAILLTSLGLLLLQRAIFPLEIRLIEIGRAHV